MVHNIPGTFFSWKTWVPRNKHWKMCSSALFLLLSASYSNKILCFPNFCLTIKFYFKEILLDLILYQFYSDYTVCNKYLHDKIIYSQSQTLRKFLFKKIWCKFIKMLIKSNPKLINVLRYQLQFDILHYMVS